MFRYSAETHDIFKPHTDGSWPWSGVDSRGEVRRTAVDTQYSVYIRPANFVCGVKP